MKMERVDIKHLSLDLKNFRTVPQPDEVHAIQAMIAINPTKFWGLMESILDDGYTPTDNILVLRSGKRKLTVKEGNRRIAILKIIHGYQSADQFDVPSHLADRLEKIDDSWKKGNEKVPCCIYETNEATLLDRVISRTHGKGDKASRDPWRAVAKARHNRDVNKASEPGLDLLEQYLSSGKNLTALQRERWAGDYPVTILDEALKRLATRMSLTSKEIADYYPKKAKWKRPFEDLMLQIGNGHVSFDVLRNPPDFAEALNFPIPTLTGQADKNDSTPGDTEADGGDGSGGSNGTGSPTDGKGKGKGKGKGDPAVSLSDPRSVVRVLSTFVPHGNGREKVVTVLEEIRQLRLDKHPISFCLLLRCLFELSAKAYCADQGKAAQISTKKDGNDRKLVDVLRDIVSHLTTGENGKKDQAKLKDLHGAMTVLATPESLLSVTSMNALIHHETFTMDSAHIARLFHNVFPLLKAMNP